MTARYCIRRSDILDLKSATLSSTKKLSEALFRSRILLRKTKDIGVITPMFGVTDKARELHAIGFSQINQFGQCHRYVLAAACLWLDCVETNMSITYLEIEDNKWLYANNSSTRSSTYSMFSHTNNVDN